MLAYRRIYPSRNRMKSTIGRPRCTISQRQQSYPPVSRRNHIRHLDYQVYHPWHALIVGWNKNSIAYTSLGQKRFNQPFDPPPQALIQPPFPLYQEGDVVGVGFRPRTGTVFFTRNGKKLEEIIHQTFKSANLFPTVGATGPCSIHINFGQAGFVFIEANVKKWGLAPMTGTLAPPPRYGREDESILLDSGRQHSAPNQPKYGRHARGQSWVSVGGSNNARTQTMQSDISLSSLPNHSPPSYSSFSDGEEIEDGEHGHETPPETTDVTPLIQREETSD
jgi:hypothetical protein